MNKDRVFSLRINKELYNAAKKKAKEDDRSLNSYIVSIIKKELK